MLDNMNVITASVLFVIAISACQAYLRPGYRSGVWGRQNIRSDNSHISPGYGINHGDFETTHIHHGDHVHTIRKAVPHIYTGNTHRVSHGYGGHDLSHTVHSHGHDGYGLGGYRSGFAGMRHGFDGRFGEQNFGHDGHGFGFGRRFNGFRNGHRFGGDVHGHRADEIVRGPFVDSHHAHEHGHAHGGFRDGNRRTRGRYGRY